jgi:hypothetical protein
MLLLELYYAVSFRGTGVVLNVPRIIWKARSINALVPRIVRLQYSNLKHTLSCVKAKLFIGGVDYAL